MEANPVTLNTVPLAFDAAIRPAVAEDIPKLEWFGQYWRFRRIFERTYRDQQKERRLMLVADVNDFPVGQIFIQFNSTERQFADGKQRAYLYSLRVLTPFRGHGLGTQLVHVAEQHSQQRGFGTTTIAVAKDNERALRLYDRLGYTIFADDPGTWSFLDPKGRQHEVREPCWVLEKHLIWPTAF